MMYLNFKPQKTLAVLLGLSLLALVRCKMPDDPLLPTDNAVFAMNGTLNGQPFSLEAGENGYYMFTEYTYNPADSLYRFVGKLEKAGCTGCGNSIEFLLADAESGTGLQPADIVNALKDNSYPYVNNKKFANKEYTLTFTAQETGFTSPKYTWFVGNGITTDTTKTSITVVYSDSAERNVCLTVTDNKTLCSNTTCNTIKPFNVDDGDSLVPDFDFTVGKTILFTNKSVGNSFLWEFGDGNISTAYSPEYLYKSPNTYRVCLSSTINGITRKICKNVNYKDSTTHCVVNYNYTNPKVTGTPARQNSQIIIRYTDDKGEVFESSVKAQPGGSFFNLLSHTAFDNNEKGEKTRRLTVSFNCRLYSTTTANYKDIVINNGHIAVAYP